VFLKDGMVNDGGRHAGIIAKQWSVVSGQWADAAVTDRKIIQTTSNHWPLTTGLRCLKLNPHLPPQESKAYGDSQSEVPLYGE